ncbi:MAG TPA: phosphoglucomutase/phosphomannomutase family protein [Verrucomicrobiae bacterium]|nr:phosphoglucomutase/phosphomannomutase family protein [Verrucomicrobiae bacterium]
MSPIKFGTAGWRALIARDFTFANVRFAAQGVAEYLQGQLADKKSSIYGRAPLIFIAYDCRFLGREFALAVAEVFTANGLRPVVFDRDTPTPVLAFTIRQRQAIGGINITASHNPPEYSGFKFSTADGAGAPPEVTRQIEAAIERLMAAKWTFKSVVTGSFQAKTADPRPAYVKQIKKLIDFSAIKKARLKIAVDLMHGCGRGYLDALLEEADARLTVFHADRNPLFGGFPPEPSSAHLADVRQAIKSGRAKVGLATDGDADRFGVMDETGTFLTPNQVLTLALYHLVKNRKWTGAVARTVPTSQQVDALARHFGIPVRETPVGFKYIGGCMEKEAVIVGGEESGGLSVKGHVPEKDGILACLLMAELMAVEKKSLGAILKDVARITGPFFTDRINLHVAPAQKDKLIALLGAGPKKIGAFPVEKFITIDGFKFVFADDEWIAFRASGTEPVFRCYIEAHSKKHFAALQAAARALLQ